MYLGRRAARIVLLLSLLLGSKLSAAEKEAIFVVGMHRSGTSAITGVLQILGVHLGGPLLKAGAGNFKGHFEHVPMLKVNESILQSLGSSWDDPRPLNMQWNSRRAYQIKEQIKQQLQSHFGSQNIFGLKDPRLCLLLPAYISAVQELGYKPKVILMLRSPAEIAGSLYTREGMPRGKALALIRKYNSAALEHTKNIDTFVVRFNQLVNHPILVVRQLKKFLPELNVRPSTCQAVCTFISKDLKHHNPAINKQTVSPEPPVKYTYDLSICAMFKNEGPYLKEWIEFHKLVGVQHFYLYDNNIGPEVDNYKEVLAPYIKSGEVELIPWHEDTSQVRWFDTQRRAYDDALERTRYKTKWLAFLDLDEFLVPVKKNNLVEFLKDYEAYGGLYVNWQMYGTSGVQDIPKNKLLIETLVMKAPTNHPDNFKGKSIVRPERAESCDRLHFFKYKEGYFSVFSTKTQKRPVKGVVPVDDIRINHYWTRTEKFLYDVKLGRRQQWGDERKSILVRAKAFNQVKDEIMMRFVPRLRKAMGLR